MGWRAKPRVYLLHDRHRADSQLLSRADESQDYGAKTIALNGLWREAGFAPLHIRPEGLLHPVTGGVTKAC